MKNYRLILIIGITEILIGSLALLGNTISLALSINTKTPNVLFFVIITAIISTLLGIGILRFNKTAYQLLLYFSSVIVLTKLLILLGIIQLSGQLEITIHKIFNIPLPEIFKTCMINLKNYISILYHGFLIYYLKKKNIKQIFHL